MERDRVLRADQSRLVWEAAYKCFDLEMQLLDQTGGELPDHEPAPGTLHDRWHRLSRFVSHYSFIEGGPFEAPYSPEKRVEKKDRMQTIGNLSQDVVERIEGALVSMMGHGGSVQSDGQRSPITIVQEEAGLSKSQWAAVRAANKKLGFISYERDGESSKIKAASLVPGRVEELIEGGRLSDDTMDSWKLFMSRPENNQEGAVDTAAAAEQGEAAGSTDGDTAGEPTGLAEAAFDLHKERQERELAERDSMTPEERAEDTARRAVESVTAKIDAELRAKHTPKAKSKNRLDRERTRTVEIKMEAGGESFELVTSGRFFAEADDDVRLLISISQLASPRYRDLFDTRSKRSKFILDRMNLARAKAEQVSDPRVKKLMHEALERGDLAVNGSGLPAVTAAGVQRVREAKIEPDTPGYSY